MSTVAARRTPPADTGRATPVEPDSSKDFPELDVLQKALRIPALQISKSEADRVEQNQHGEGCEIGLNESALHQPAGERYG